ncbi:MAG: bacterial nucleoid DNA-binding protein [Chloroflexi bacterium]|nr:bacterial nucleoid DNA-binding protein [Chloroflexota bacterium]
MYQEMSQRIEKAQLVRLVTQRTKQNAVLVEEITDAVFEEIVAALERGQCVSLRNFGSFYVRSEREPWVFKFNPSQRLRRLFGWS